MSIKIVKTFLQCMTDYFQIKGLKRKPYLSKDAMIIIVRT